MPSLPPPPSNQHHRERLARQQPRAWKGELPEDVALFDDAVLATLSAELAEQVLLVREALQAATQSRGEAALKSLSVISRSSPLSDWRLFIRGLTDWLANQTEAAAEAWRRLDPERRPGRIAVAMMLSLRPDPEQVSQQENPTTQANSLPWERRDDQQLYHAKLLYRVRIDRVALRIAERELSKPDELPEILLGPMKFGWLKKFIREYQDTEPELTSALEQAALDRAFSQQYFDMFELVAKSLTGVRHDPQNSLLAYHYYCRFDDQLAEEKADNALDRYLKRDLHANENLSETLRGAIASQIYLDHANNLVGDASRSNFMGIFSSFRVDSHAIRANFKKALKAYPGNVSAYKDYVSWIQSSLDDRDTTQAKRNPLEKELAGIMRDWSKHQAEAVEPRLWLVDYLLENEQLTEAQPHVEFLSGSRHTDPRIRATPWKWQLLEVMRLCRRKTWLGEVPARLEEADKLWPAWLSRDWLPYLKAAYLLRSGQTEAYELARQQICDAAGRTRDSLCDACMMLGVAQRMRVPAGELKPLREPIERALKTLDNVPIEDLIDVVGFFWDLQRTQLIYPAHRMHGGKIGQALLARLSQSQNLVNSRKDDERFHKAVLWCSEHLFWVSRFDYKLPTCFRPLLKQKHPIFVAANVNAILKTQYHWGSQNYKDSGPILRDAAGKQRDQYYRHWFQALAEELDDVVSQEYSTRSGIDFGNFFDD